MNMIWINFNAQLTVDSGRAKATGPKYIRVYDSTNDTTFGTSEYGPWEVRGDKRMLKTEDYVLIPISVTEDLMKYCP